MTRERLLDIVINGKMGDNSDMKTSLNNPSNFLDVIELPAIVVSKDYTIEATNTAYESAFGRLDLGSSPKCFAVSHGYDKPCDQSGEDCPMRLAITSGQKSRVLHVHHTPRGREYVDVEMIPISDENGDLTHFVEVLKPVENKVTTHEPVKVAGTHPAFRNVLSQVSRVADSDIAVLLLGESGTGKEVVAQSIHQQSRRNKRPMVTLECSGLTETLFESELFGHTKGAFTGANFERQGLASAADGGTLFLDEVGDIPLSLQVKLLRLIETGSYRPIGSSEPKHTDFRLICATHHDLWQRVQEGAFRLDLYYRINVFPILMPRLTDRRSDIPLIADAILESLGRNNRYHLTQAAQALLQQADWPGNIRELRNFLLRASVLNDGNVLAHELIGRLLDERRASMGGEKELSDPSSCLTDYSLAELERRYFAQLLEQHQGDKKATAKKAGISLRTLYRKLESLNS